MRSNPAADVGRTSPDQEPPERGQAPSRTPEEDDGLAPNPAWVSVRLLDGERDIDGALLLALAAYEESRHCEFPLDPERVPSRWAGWMRPGVRKVGAVQAGTGVLAEGALFTGVSWPRWALALLGYFIHACVGHSVGHHRYFAFNVAGRTSMRTNVRAPRVSGRRSRGPRFTGAGATWLLVTLCVLPITLSWTGAAMADTKIAMSRSPPPDPITLGLPRLSPDGKLAALHVHFDEYLPRLVVFDIDREELVVVDRPDNEGWVSPSFSPSGDRIAFIRYCVEECAVGTQGFQVSILDRKSGATTTVTSGRKFFRYSPLFSPGGQSIVIGSKVLVWKDDFLARGFGWRHRRPHSTAGGGTLRMVDLKTGLERKLLNDSFRVTQFSAVFPAGFLDENTLIFNARGPAGASLTDNSSSPLFQELKRLVGKKDAKYRLYGYRLTLEKKLEFMSPDAPKRIGPVTFLSVSADTGRMVFGDSSELLPDHQGLYGYEVFIGDGETFQPATSEPQYMVFNRPVISKMGNRVIFLADETRKWKHWSLWVLDVETGRVRETSLKRRLHEWHRS